MEASDKLIAKAFLRRARALLAFNVKSFAAPKRNRKGTHEHTDRRTGTRVDAKSGGRERKSPLV